MEKNFKELEQISALFEAEPIQMSLMDFAKQTFSLVDGILSGGLLMSVYASPRLTMDLDLLVVASNDAKEILISNGYKTSDHLQYSKPDREILKLEKHQRDVDLIFFKDKKVEEFLVSTSAKKHLFGKDIRILSIEGFLLTKLISWRTKDRADIEAVLERKPVIDMDSMRDMAMHIGIFDRMAIFDI